MFYRLTQAQAEQLKTLRASRASRRYFWRGIRNQLRLGSSRSTGTIRVAYADTNNPLWLILRSKRTNLPIGGTPVGESTSVLLALGLAKPTLAPTPEPQPKTAPAASSKAKPKAPARKASASKPAAPSKSTAAVKKPVAVKKAPAVKKLAEKASKAAPAVKKAVKATAKAKPAQKTTSTKASKPAATRPASKAARKSVAR